MRHHETKVKKKSESAAIFGNIFSFYLIFRNQEGVLGVMANNTPCG
jgi:hypothetical protein